MSRQAICTGVAVTLLLCTASASADMADEAPALRGSGKVVSQPRQTDAFAAIDDKAAVDLDLKEGPAASVSVDADDNLQPLIRTEVVGGVLVVESGGGWTSRRHPVVHVTAPSLSTVRVLGGGNASLNGLSGKDLSLTLGGAGSLEASGKVGHLRLRTEGTGDAKLDEVEAQDVDVQVNGTGDSLVYADNSVAVVFKGAGNVHYAGRPAHVASQGDGGGNMEPE